jgi:hypothetical protein
MASEGLVDVVGMAIQKESLQHEFLVRDALARAALKAIEEAGYVVAPKEPTEDMREAAIADRMTHPDGVPPGSAMASMYRAMIAAAQRDT